MQNPLRNIPSVNELLESPPLRRLVGNVSRNVVVSGVRSFLDDLRTELQTAAADVKWPTSHDLAQRIADWIQTDDRPSLRPVINATGILLHTGLGRAPLAKEAIQAIMDVAAGYASVEVDLESGERSQRAVPVKKLLVQLTGAEDAVVVNNNAAATMLTLAALAHGREVIVSRGQLIEIGGSFRLPEVMTSSGATLREVGTTNKTRVADYEAAINERTALIFRAHTSNFRIVGFTEEATLSSLVAVGRRYNVPVIDDIGSGALIDYAKYGVAGEPVASESIRAGADLVLFSGDKLLGGPQAGIIAGRSSLVEQISVHPSMRALRVDKVTLAALVATLRLYRDPDTAERNVPLLMLLSTSSENLKHRAERLVPQIMATGMVNSAEPFASTTFLGGGSLPMQEIATYCVAMTPKDGSVDALAKVLRQGQPGVIGRVQQDRLLFDLRSVFPHQDAQLVDALESARRSADEKPKQPGPAAGSESSGPPLPSM
jgi:L-seryl-tRNA(Ser) seleniumtransferase